MFLSLSECIAANGPGLCEAAEGGLGEVKTNCKARGRRCGGNWF